MFLELIRNVLIVTPHADDEVLGCGGTIKKLTDAGINVDLVVMAAGGIKHHHLATPVVYQQRQQELTDSCKTLGIRSFRILYQNFDMKLEQLDKTRLVSDLDTILEKGTYDCVMVPRESHNQDHRETHFAMLAALRPSRQLNLKLVLAYEGTSKDLLAFPELSTGKLYIDISNEFDAKIAALNCYKSQIRAYPHPTSIEAMRRLAECRGLESNLDKAERFDILQAVIS
ncbi:PIG-L deacetylase family protein [Pseudidiomarina sp. PP-1MA]|uniref:PIG-L deacetylase family protein n=1 Tax=Pseudidiomarina sp. PP-1MA TaxID=3237706 RepID=A0AB39X9H8_9GAMM